MGASSFGVENRLAFYNENRFLPCNSLFPPEGEFQFPTIFSRSQELHRKHLISQQYI